MDSVEVKHPLSVDQNPATIIAGAVKGVLPVGGKVQLAGEDQPVLVLVVVKVELDEIVGDRPAPMWREF